MSRFIVVTGFFAYVLLIQGSAWAESSAALAQTSVENIRELQQASTARVEALQQLVAEVNSSAKDGTVQADDESVDAADAGKRKSGSATGRNLSPPTPRSDEASFAKRLQPQQLRERKAFDQLQNRLANIDDPEHQIDAYQTFLEDHPGHRDARLHLSRLWMLSDQPSKALITLPPSPRPFTKTATPIGSPGFGWVLLTLV